MKKVKGGEADFITTVSYFHQGGKGEMVVSKGKEKKGRSGFLCTFP